MPEPLDDVYVSNFKRLRSNTAQQTNQSVNLDSSNSTELTNLSAKQQKTTRKSKNKKQETEHEKVEEKADAGQNESAEQKNTEQEMELKQKTEVKEDDTQETAHHEIDFEPSKNRSKQSTTPIEVELDRTHDITTQVVEESIPNTLSRSEVQTIATMMASLPDTPSIINPPISATQSVDTRQKPKTSDKKKTTLKVAELRKLCEDNNLETFGVKEVLIKRLEKHNLL
jgi:hypothetical protein